MGGSAGHRYRHTCVSTRSDGQSRPQASQGPPWSPLLDPAEALAQVALSRRELMLTVHRFRLRREDLEDCYSQATLELLLAARAGRIFAGRAHMANAIELRFLSRVRDRRRAISGRSPMEAAIEGAVPLDGQAVVIEVLDLRSEPERVVMSRQELELLRDHAGRLTQDQRLVLACQVALGMGCREFCRLHGWSPEKYRKVAQRGRARLRQLIAREESVPTAAGTSDQEPGTRP